MTLQDVGLYIFYGMFYLFLIVLFVEDKWPYLLHRRKSKKKRKHRVKTF